MPQRKIKIQTTRTASDLVADAISNVANSVEKKEPPKPKRSRFFFKLGEPELIKFEETKTVNARIVKETDKLQKELPRTLEPLMADVRNFFLQEIAPLALAGVSGAEQARSMLSDAVGLPVDATTEMKFRALMTKAVDIKLVNYIAKFMNLSKEDAHVLLQTLQPQRPANVVFPLSNDRGSYARQKKKDQAPEGGRRHSPSGQGEDDLP